MLLLVQASTPSRTDMNFLDSAKYLYLRELTEPRDNSLRLVVQEALVNPSGVVRSHPELPELGELSISASPIESTDTCKSFELTWERYVAYLVTEECVGSCGQYGDEVFTGSLFRDTQSHIFLSILRETLAATPRKSFIIS